MEKALFFESTSKERDLDACRIVESFYNMGQMVLVLVGSTIEATHFDDLLWTFHKENFVPHMIISNPSNIIGALERVFIVPVGNNAPIEGVDTVIYAGEADVGHLLSARNGVVFVLMDDAQKRQNSREIWKELGVYGVERLHFSATSKKEWAKKIRDIFGAEVQ